MEVDNNTIQVIPMIPQKFFFPPNPNLICISLTLKYRLVYKKKSDIRPLYFVKDLGMNISHVVQAQHCRKPVFDTIDIEDCP